MDLEVVASAAAQSVDLKSFTSRSGVPLDAVSSGRRKYRNPPPDGGALYARSRCNLNNRPNKTVRDRDAPARNMPIYWPAHRDDSIAFAATLERRLLIWISWLSGSHSFEGNTSIPSLRASNDEVERRGASPASNEGTLSQPSTPSLAHRRCDPRSLEPIVSGRCGYVSRTDREVASLYLRQFALPITPRCLRTRPARPTWEWRRA
jgi:hypothetical protein